MRGKRICKYAEDADDEVNKDSALIRDWNLFFPNLLHMINAFLNKLV